MIPDNKSKSNDVFSVWLWVLIFASLSLGIWSLSLHTSDQEEFVTASTFLVANIAILSTIIVICAFVVTATGLAKLESIEEKAIETAKEAAKETATKTTQEILENEKFLQEVAEAAKKHYNQEGVVLPSRPLKETGEKETGKNED